MKKLSKLLIVFSSLFLMSFSTTSRNTNIIKELDNEEVKRYSITYELRGGEILDEDYPLYYLDGEVVEFPTNLKRKFGVFNGWYVNPSLTGNTITNTSGLHEDLVLYASYAIAPWIYALMFIIPAAFTISTLIIGRYVDRKNRETKY